MSLRIIGAGLPRTGTLSLKAALEQLGYGKCHHMFDVMLSSRQVNQWHDIMEGETPDWDDVFQGYDACVDFPSSLYFRELAAANPDAKVILTVRPPADWYASMRDTIYKVETSVPRWVQWCFPRIGKLTELADRLVWQGLFDGRFENESYARAEFERHVDDVKAAIPKERLLVMEVKDGWAPLCVFLGVPEPDTPFPRVNDKGQFRRMTKTLKRLSIVPWLLLGVVVIVAGAMVGLTYF